MAKKTVTISTPQDDSKQLRYSQFQLKEYENISQAHFKTNESIATFYRYYLIVMAIPITVVSVASGKSNIDASTTSSISTLFNADNLPLSLFVILVGIFGVAILFYIEGLRLDAVLYARTVNSVRRYFNTVEAEPAYAIKPVLPTDTSVPTFKLKQSHGPIFFAAALFNSFYLTLGVVLLLKPIKWLQFDVSPCLQNVIYVLLPLATIGFQLWYHRMLSADKDTWVKEASK